MIPTLHFSPGEMTPGQFGPIRRVFLSFRNAAALTMSRVGMPSVMQTTRGIPASVASMIASAAPGGGTKITETLAPVLRTASSTLSKSENPSTVVPPLPGVTPPTTLVPYSRQPIAWNVPCFPIPWTRSRVSFPTRTLTPPLPRPPPPCSRHRSSGRR